VQWTAEGEEVWGAGAAYMVTTAAMRCGLGLSHGVQSVMLALVAAVSWEEEYSHKCGVLCNWGQVDQVGGRRKCSAGQKGLERLRSSVCGLTIFYILGSGGG
jgi:hypothetical protein